MLKPGLENFEHYFTSAEAEKTITWRKMEWGGGEYSEGSDFGSEATLEPFLRFCAPRTSGHWAQYSKKILNSVYLITSLWEKSCLCFPPTSRPLFPERTRSKNGVLCDFTKEAGFSRMDVSVSISIMTLWQWRVVTLGLSQKLGGHRYGKKEK